MNDDWGNDPIKTGAPPAAKSADWGDDPLKTGTPPTATTSSAAPKFPFDDPHYSYGNILPFRGKVDEKGNPISGTLEPAVPEIIRSPVRGLMDLNARLHSPAGYQAPMTPDELGTLMTVGGVRVSPASIIEKTTAKAAAQAAHDAGYVLPPVEATKPVSLTSKVLSSPAGKIKTQQLASETNQGVTNELAATSLGLPKDTVLSADVFRNIRAQAGKAYEAVKQAVPQITSDDEYDTAVSSLGGANSQAAKHFPNITKNQGILDLVDELKQVKEFPTEAGVEIVKELRYNATANLKAMDDPSRHALGLAQRQAADLVDDLMERNIEKTGNTGAIAAYKQARRLIAKSYDVEGATNPSTGDVNAVGLAKLSAKGRPLTDELATIAKAASAFPKSMQNPANFGGAEPWSALDFFGAAGSAAAGHPGAGAAILARPLVRSTILSKPYQRSMMQPSVDAALPAHIRALLNPGLTQGVPGVMSTATPAENAYNGLGMP